MVVSTPLSPPPSFRAFPAPFVGSRNATILVLVVVFFTQDTPQPDPRQCPAPIRHSVAVATSPASRRLPELIHPKIPSLISLIDLFKPTIATTVIPNQTKMHQPSIQAAPLQQRSDLPSLFEPTRETRLPNILPALLHFHQVVREYDQHPVPKSLVVSIKSHTKTPARSLSLTDYSYLYR